MLKRTITEADVDAVLAAPTKIEPGDGCQCRFKDQIMTQPTNVRTDLSVSAAYIEYGSSKSETTVFVNAMGSVAYDIDADGNVIGIEIIGIEHADRIAIASEFAASRELAFPRDLSGVLVKA